MPMPIGEPIRRFRSKATGYNDCAGINSADGSGEAGGEGGGARKAGADSRSWNNYRDQYINKNCKQGQFRYLPLSP